MHIYINIYIYEYAMETIVGMHYPCTVLKVLKLPFPFR